MSLALAADTSCPEFVKIGFYHQTGQKTIYLHNGIVGIIFSIVFDSSNEALPGITILTFLVVIIQYVFAQL